MLYIEKDRVSKEVQDEINRVKRDTNWRNLDKSDARKVRGAFDLLDKSMLRRHLIAEQKGLCAYCMRRIHNDHTAVIEHWMPITSNGEKALDYNNMMACCDGGKTDSSSTKVLCCDAAKGDKQITISPYNASHMSKIRYRKDGYLKIYPEDKTLVDDINNILKLNGEIGDFGNSVCDTATGLVYGRRKTYENYETFIRGLQKKNKPIGVSVSKKIEEISNSDEYIEYAGVWLYFLRRKLRRHKGEQHSKC